MQRSIALQESTSTRLSCSLSLAGNKHLMKHLLSISQTRTQGAQWPSRVSMVSHVIEVCIYPKQGDGEIIWDYIFWFISLLSPVVSTCFFAGMINTEKKYCAEVRMASFPGSAASLIPTLSPPPIFERRVTWNKAMQRMPMFQRTRIVRVSVRYILLSWCVMCLPCSRFRLQRQQFESDAILQYLMLYWVWGWPQGKHYDTIEYTCMCVYIVKICTDPCMVNIITQYVITGTYSVNTGVTIFNIQKEHLCLYHRKVEVVYVVFGYFSLLYPPPHIARSGTR